MLNKVLAEYKMEDERMANVIEKVKSLLGGKKEIKVELSNSEKIESAKNRADFALGMFADVKSELVEVNQELTDVVEKSKTLVNKLTSEIESAEAEIEANNALIERVQQFTK